MFSAQGRASVRVYRCKLATTKRNDMSASDYFNLMKGFADAMATVGAPLPDDELIYYILAGLGKEFSALQASLNVFSNANPNAVILLTDFYSMLMSHEAMQDTVDIDFSSSANAARCGNQGGGHFGGDHGHLTIGPRRPGGGHPRVWLPSGPPPALVRSSTSFREK
jgi:hypothetical protein